jgi:hypothetical protein
MSEPIDKFGRMLRDNDCSHPVLSADEIDKDDELLENSIPEERDRDVAFVEADTGIPARLKATGEAKQTFWSVWSGWRWKVGFR